MLKRLLKVLKNYLYKITSYIFTGYFLNKNQSIKGNTFHKSHGLLTVTRLVPTAEVVMTNLEYAFQVRFQCFLFYFPKLVSQTL